MQKEKTGITEAERIAAAKQSRKNKNRGITKAGIPGRPETSGKQPKTPTAAEAEKSLLRLTRGALSGIMKIPRNDPSGSTRRQVSAEFFRLPERPAAPPKTTHTTRRTDMARRSRTICCSTPAGRGRAAPPPPPPAATIRERTRSAPTRSSRRNLPFSVRAITANRPCIS